jgi:hypothetical protein
MRNAEEKMKEEERRKNEPRRGWGGLGSILQYYRQKLK